MKKIFLFVLIILCSCIRPAAQQIPPELKRKIDGKRNLKAIMKEVEGYYKKEDKEKERKFGKGQEDEEEEFESGLLHWKRWEYFNQTRLKPNGDLEDIAAKTDAAWEKVNRKYVNSNRTESGTNATWTFLGPSTMNYQGGLYRGLSRIDRIVFHPTDPNTFYACANNGGLWRTTNGGTTWSSLTFNFPILSASGVVINPSNPSNIFVLTGDAKGGNGIRQNSCGIWVTYDGGNNWFKTNFTTNITTNTDAGYKLVMMPGNSSVLFACTNGGLYRSSDSGINWAAVISSGPIYDIEFDPSSSSRVYISRNGAFWLSTDSGVTWPVAQRTTIAGATRIEISVSPANNNYVYLLCGPYVGGVGTSNFGGVYRSPTKGSAGSFALRANSPNILCDAINGVVAASDAGDQSGYDLAIDVNKTNAETIIVAGKIIWTSTNGGTTLTNLTLYNEGSTAAIPPANYIHPDIQDIAYNPLNNNLYACTDGGVYLSTDGGANWSNITGGLHTSTFYHMGGASFDINRIAGGAQDNGIKFKYNSGDFTHVTGADGFDCSFGPSLSSHLYTTINSSVGKFDLNGVAAAVTTPSNTSFFPVIAADPVTLNTVYLCAGAPGVMKSTNGGSTWTQVLNQTAQQSICTCPSNSNRVYVTSLTSIYRTDNGGTNWSTDLAANPGFGITGQISDISVCSTNSSLVFVVLGGYTAGNKVFYSNDGGANWNNLSGTLPAEVKVNCTAIDQSGNAYIGTDMGVYYCAVSSFDWTPFYNGLPWCPVTDLSINQTSSRITCSTYGHGMWYTGLYTTCDVNINLTGAIDGEKFYQVSGQITSTLSIVGGNETRVIFRAGNEIVLSPNFTAYDGTTFRAYIGPCDGGPVPTARTSNKSPSFMTQSDRGDTTTLYSLGYITVDQPIHGKTNIMIHAVKTGTFLLLVTDKDEGVKLNRVTEDMDAGTIIIKRLDTGLLSKGKYYAQLYYNGKLAHVQELILQ